MCDYTVLSAAFGGAMFDKNGNPTLTADGKQEGAGLHGEDPH